MGADLLESCVAVGVLGAAFAGGLWLIWGFASDFGRDRWWLQHLCRTCNRYTEHRNKTCTECGTTRTS